MSYENLIGKKLCDIASNEHLSSVIKILPFPIASHTNNTVPTFNYANDAMLRLFGMHESEFIGLDSKLSATRSNQVERQKLLDEVHQHGFIENYQGYRVRKDGTEFFIKKATIWNVYNAEDEFDGQAVIIYEWSD